MIDLVKLILIAGNGGYGRVSFRREKYVPKGGPDGGSGGNGGDVIIRGNQGLSTLKHLAGKKVIQAENGDHGGKRKKEGKKGNNVVVEVPLGTVVHLIRENKCSAQRTKDWLLLRKLTDQDKKANQDVKIYQDKKIIWLKRRKDEIELEKYDVEKIGQGIPTQERDPLSKKETDSSQILLEITQDGQEYIICQGGFGGRGNTAFKSASHQTPLEAECGSVGEIKEVNLELKLLADLGLVGFPNAGKSTFLSKVTKANPKIANYPFTTLEPNLGILDFQMMKSVRLKPSSSAKKEIVIADIPGLIEGASQGKGLGFSFLRHLEHCRMLLFMLYLEESIVFNQEIDNQAKAVFVWQQYQSLKKELSNYSLLMSKKMPLVESLVDREVDIAIDLISKPYILSLNKIDIYNKKLIDTICRYFQSQKEKIVPFSAVTGEGLADLVKCLE